LDDSVKALHGPVCGQWSPRDGRPPDQCADVDPGSADRADRFRDSVRRNAESSRWRRRIVLFLNLFTTAREPLPAFVGFLGLLVPLIGIALAFDAVNGEFNQRTISKILAQPIYRDALLFGKFLAGLGALALTLSAIWLLIIGLGLLQLGAPPDGEEVVRILWFLLVTIFYGGIWLALAMLFQSSFVSQPRQRWLQSLSGCSSPSFGGSLPVCWRNCCALHHLAMRWH